MRYKLLTVLFCVIFTVMAVEVSASELNLSMYYRGFDILAAESVSDELGRLSITVNPAQVNKSSELYVRELPLTEFAPFTGKTPLTEVIDIQLINYEAESAVSEITIKLTEPSKLYKQVYFWSGKGWQSLSTVSIDESHVRVKVNKLNWRLAVFGDQKMEYGMASWYKYKSCLCAASPDYPKGTILRVTNLDNNKSVDVRVNDFGPERNIFPERVIDLDKEAFRKLGPLSWGVLRNVRVQKIK